MTNYYNNIKLLLTHAEHIQTAPELIQYRFVHDVRLTICSENIHNFGREQRTPHKHHSNGMTRKCQPFYVVL